MYKAIKFGKNNIVARVVADSIANGIRITTFELEYHRFIHGELMTNRLFSRNAMSSRAIPVKRMIQQVDSTPAVPIYWGKNQPGMQAKEECNEFVYLPEVLRLDGSLEEVSVTHEEAWQHANTLMVDMATVFDNAHYHKQVVNRLLEPFQ